MAVLCGLAATLHGAEVEEKQFFDISERNAAKALKEFVEQSGAQLLYSSDMIRGIATQPVFGTFSAQDALVRMVEGTELVVRRGETNGVLFLSRKAPGDSSASLPESTTNLSNATNMKTPRKTPRRLASALLLLLGFGQASAQTTAAPTAGTDVTTADVAAGPGNGRQPIVLSPFEVSASGDVGYGATNTSTTSRIAQAYIDVPQTVNVITKEFINDFNIMDERQLFQYTPNMLMNFGDTTGRTIRASQVNATYVDGLLQVITSQSQPLEFYDRVEIVKGPTSAGFGVGEPGGIINYISKTPQGVDRTDLSFGVGDYHNYLFKLDTQGSLEKDKNISYRLNAFYDYGDYRIDVQQHHGAGGQLALKDQVNPKLTAQLIVGYSNTTVPQNAPVTNFWRNIYLYSFWRELVGDAYPALPNTPKNPGNSVFDWAKGATLIGIDDEPLADGWQQANNQLFSAESIVDFAINENLNVRNGLVFQQDQLDQDDTTSDGLNINPPGYAPGYYTPAVRSKTMGNYKGFVDDIDFLADYKFGIFESKTLIGATYSQNKNDTIMYNLGTTDQNGKVLQVNIFNGLQDRTPWPDIVSERVYTQNNTTNNYGFGYYLQEDLLAFNGMLDLSAGWREDYEHDTFRDILAQSTTSPGWVNNRGVPRYSVTVKPFKWLSVYALYSEHEDPSQNVQTYILYQGTATPALAAQYGNFLPRTFYSPGGKQVEVGSKASFLQGRITASVAVFHEINTGQLEARVVERNTNPDGTQTSVEQNEISGVNAHGIEAELFGQFTNRLSGVVDFGTTTGHFPNFTQPNDPAGFAGQPHWWSEAPTLGLHARYDFGDLRGNGFYITFGGQYYWGFWVYQDPYAYIPGGQKTFDGGIGYRWGHGKIRQSLYLNDDNFTRQLVLNGNADTSPSTNVPREQGFLTYTLSY